MKRITPFMKRLDLIATFIDALYIIVYAILLYVLFDKLVVPEIIIDTLDLDYVVLGITLSTAQVNTLISLLIGYLIVFVPVTFGNFRRLSSKEFVEIEPWLYRTQHLYAVMSLFTLNVFSASIRAYLGYEIKKLVDGKGFKASLKDYYENTQKLFTKTYWAERKAKKETRKELSESQQDLEAITRKDLITKVLRLTMTYTFLTFVALFIFIPFYWMILTALKTNQELTTFLNPRFFVGLEEMQWINFKVALTQFDFTRYILNTLYVGILSMFGTLFTTILASFAFSRLEFKGREFIFSILLMTMMIPGELYTITNFITIRNLGWYDSFSALIFPFMTSVFYIFFLRQTFRQIPDTLYRAAQVDGCGDFKYLSRVMIPIARPTIITITILSAIGAWDAYIWPQLVTPSQENWLISVALRGTSFVVGSGSDARPVYNIQLAATALVTAPLLIIFFSLKKYIIRGVGRSGIKG